MSVEARGKGIWRIRVYDAAGVQRERKIHGTKQEAQAFEARFRLELQSQSIEQAQRRTVPSFLQFCAEEFNSYIKLHLRKRTVYNLQHLLSNIAAELGTSKLNQIREPQIQKYASERLKTGLKPVSVNNELRALKRVFNFARESGYLIAKVKIRMLEETDSRAHAFEKHELDALLSECLKGDLTRQIRPENLKNTKTQDVRILPLVLFLANTGCRKGEAIALKWECVDFIRREIRIWPSDDWRPKSGKPREIPMSDALFNLLQNEYTRRESEWVFSRKGGHQYAGFPRRNFEAAIKAAGLTGGPHTLRHTFASMFLAKCPDTGVLAAILGHSDEAVTRLYSHMLPDRLSKARNVISVEAPSFVEMQKISS